MGKAIVKFFIGQKKAINLFVLFVSIVGSYLIINTPKEAFPPIDFRQIYITTSYPGTSAELIEALVTKKIEDKLEGIAGAKKITSTSLEGLSRIIFEVDESYPKGSIEVGRSIKSAIENISGFPTDMTNKPQILRIDNSVIPIISVIVSSDDTELLYKKSDQIEKEIKTIEGVTSIEIEGRPDNQYQIEVDPKILFNKDMSILEISKALREQNFSVPTGSIQVDDKNIYIFASQEYKDPKSIKDTIIRGNDYGNTIDLNSVSTSRWYREKPDVFQTFKGRQSVILHVSKNASGDVIEIATAVKDLIKKYKEGLKDSGLDIAYSYANDMAFYVKRRLELLSSNGLTGIIFVFLILFLFLDLRTTFWTSLEIPVALLITFMFLYLLGNTLNLMTMVGFILVIGMLVDDAVIVSENTHIHLMKGKSPKQAAIDGTAEVMTPIVAAVLTTVAAFLPILTISGVFGQFLAPIAITVSIAMMVSLFDCLFILPSHLGNSLKPLVHNEIPKKERIFNQFKNNVITPTMQYLFKRPFKTIATIFLFFGLSIWGFVDIVPKTFFLGPTEEIFVKVEFDKNYSKLDTSNGMNEVEKLLSKNMDDYNVRDIFTITGHWPTSDGSPTNDIASNFGTIQIILNVDRNKSDAKIIDEINGILKDFEKEYKPTRLLVQEKSGGPRLGKEIEIEIIADRYKDVVGANQAVLDFLKDMPNTTSVVSSLLNNKKEFLIRFNEKLAKQLKIDLINIPFTIQSAFQGSFATRLNYISYLGTDNPYIVVKLKENLTKFKTIEDFKREILDLKVPTSTGLLISLNEIIDITENNTTNSIEHKNKKNIIYVSASLKNKDDTKYTALTINNLIKDKIGGLSKKYPNVKLVIGGQKQETDTLKNDGIFAASLSLGLIFIILLALFKSYSAVLLIMIIIPFGISGIFVGLTLQTWLHEYFNIEMQQHLYTFSFMNIIGLIALSGVLVNDSSVLISFIQLLRKQGYTAFDAALEGASSRFRPILLTTLTTQFGMIPFSYGIMGDEPFLQPMGLTLVWGIAAGTVITLIFLPSLYIIVDKIQYFLHKKFNFNYEYSTKER